MPDNGQLVVHEQELKEVAPRSRWELKNVDPNWWPTLMPEVLLTIEEEDKAMLSGYEDPNEYLMAIAIATPGIEGEDINNIEV